MIDNDSINQMKTTSEPMTKETMLKDYKEVFNEKVGELEGTYKIKIKKKAKAVKHAQRKIAIPLQEQVRK